MKTRYKFALFLGATCVIILLGYFWMGSPNHSQQHPSISTYHPPTTTNDFIGIPMPMRSKPIDKMYKDKQKDNLLDETNAEYVVNTPGCKIPSTRIDFTKHNKGEKKHKVPDCGIRAVFFKKVNDYTIQAYIDTTKLKKHLNQSTNFYCNYRFFYESTLQEEKLKSRFGWQKLNDGKKINLETDFIHVRCRCVDQNVKYDDVFAFIKRKDTTSYERNHNSCKDSYNVLMLGMDSMSLARLEQTMPKTISFLNKQSALSFRGYHKVGDNTFPNLMAALSGYDLQTIKRDCVNAMDQCNVIWKKFQKLGYTTAYGEDFLGLPDTFGRGYTFHHSPTDHHIRPLFLLDEKEINKTLICNGKSSAGKQLLEYAADFVTTYQHDRFFGVFWINSVSHSENSRPQVADRHLETFFNTVTKIDILKNTFVIFFSDQGLRFGKHRMKVESYYDERLPFFFMLPPTNFQEKHTRKLRSLMTNQRRLITPYDVYDTLYDIYHLSDCREISRSESMSYACRKCQSLFTSVNVTRRCRDVAIDDKWCSCHKLNPLDPQDYSEGIKSVLNAVSTVKNTIKSIKTRPGWICADVSLEEVIRTHFYYDEVDMRLYFVVAFTTNPGNVSFEAKVSRSKIIGDLSVISPYRGLGKCTVDKSIRLRLYCFCEKNKACFE